MNDKLLMDRLEVVWDNNPPRRYVPMALKGGPFWRIYDRHTKRHLSDAEVLAMSLDDLRADLT